MKSKIYLDNNASTQVDPQVLQAMVSYMELIYGNPSSQHVFGRQARAALTASRDAIANMLNVKSREIVFTSGGTEGLNLVLQGLPTPGHIITSNVEHAAVFETLKVLETRGFQVTYLKAGIHGAVTPEAVLNALTPDTRLIALMSVNNETGVKTDIESIAQIALRAGVPFLVDAIAQLGKEPVQIFEGISAMCFSGQKIHAPMGTGFLYLSSGFKLKPLLFGGEQENGRRAGTENVPGIVALAKAVHLLKTEFSNMERLRDRLEQGILERIPGAEINGEGPRVCNVSNISFPGADGEALLTALDLAGVAASHGSACSSGALEPSRILTNMGYPKERVRSAIRFSLSRFTTEQDIDGCLNILSHIFKKS
jgi:cysteine desulfurase